MSTGLAMTGWVWLALSFAHCSSRHTGDPFGAARHCLAAARSRRGSDMPPACHSLPRRRFATLEGAALRGKGFTLAQRGAKGRRDGTETVPYERNSASSFFYTLLMSLLWRPLSRPMADSSPKRGAASRQRFYTGATGRRFAAKVLHWRNGAPRGGGTAQRPSPTEEI